MSGNSDYHRFYRYAHLRGHARIHFGATGWQSPTTSWPRRPGAQNPIKAVQLIGKRICGCLLYKLKLTQLLIMSERKSRILE